MCERAQLVDRLPQELIGRAMPMYNRLSRELEMISIILLWYQASEYYLLTCSRLALALPYSTYLLHARAHARHESTPKFHNTHVANPNHHGQAFAFVTFSIMAPNPPNTNQAPYIPRDIALKTKGWQEDHTDHLECGCDSSRSGCLL